MRVHLLRLLRRTTFALCHLWNQLKILRLSLTMPKSWKLNNIIKSHLLQDLLSEFLKNSMAYEFFKNSAAVCSTEKFPTREVDECIRRCPCSLNFILLIAVRTLSVDWKLELSCCKKRQKKSPNQETGIGDAWRFWMIPNWS